MAISAANLVIAAISLVAAIIYSNQSQLFIQKLNELVHWKPGCNPIRNVGKNIWSYLESIDCPQVQLSFGPLGLSLLRSLVIALCLSFCLSVLCHYFWTHVYLMGSSSIVYRVTNPHLENSTPTLKLNPHLAPAKATPSTTIETSPDFTYALSVG